MTLHKRPVAALAALLFLAIVLGHPTQSAAQTSTISIAVVDVQSILRDSKAAKSVRPQMEKLRANYQKEVRSREKALRTASQDLARQRAILSPEAFATKRREYESQARAAQVEVQARKRQLDRAYSLAMGKVQKTMILAAADIAETKKLDLVLPKSLILLSAKNLDITSAVMSRLDKELPSVKVTLPKLETAPGVRGGN